MQFDSKWEIGVSAGGYYPSLTSQFSSYDIGLVYEDDHMGMQFFAYSRHVDELNNPKDVSKRLYSIELLLNGALRVAWADYEPCPIKFTYFAELNVGGSHNVWADKIEEFPFQTTVLNQHTHHHLDSPKNYFPSYLFYLSKQSEELRSLLFLCGLISTNTPLENILTWSTLYKIVDCIRHYSKEISIPINDIVDPANLNKFTAACNNMSVLGLNARHGASGNPQPSSDRVITDINEAINLILGMANKFAHKYIAIKFP